MRGHYGSLGLVRFYNLINSLKFFNVYCIVIIIGDSNSEELYRQVYPTNVYVRGEAINKYKPTKLLAYHKPLSSVIGNFYHVS